MKKSQPNKPTNKQQAVSGRPFARPRELLIIGLMALAIAVFWFIQSRQPVPKQRSAVFADVNGKTLAEIPLTEGQDKDYILPGHENMRFHIYKDGSIAFVHSDCPDQVCVHTGRILRPGQFAACLPNGIILKIKADPSADGGSDGQEADIVIGHASASPSETTK